MNKNEPTPKDSKRPDKTHEFGMHPPGLKRLPLNGLREMNILLALLEFAGGRKNMKCFPSLATIAQSLGDPVNASGEYPALSRMVRSLSASGYIVMRRFRNSKGRTQIEYDLAPLWERCDAIQAEVVLPEESLHVVRASPSEYRLEAVADDDEEPAQEHGVYEDEPATPEEVDGGDVDDAGRGRLFNAIDMAPAPLKAPTFSISNDELLRSFAKDR